jgi:N-acyl homoserine lactone hydrolase
VSVALSPDVIVRLHLGKIWLPKPKIEIPVHGFLIKHPKGAGLVDTGYGSQVELIKDYRAVNAPVADALKQHGLSPADIKWVVNSHLHWDHCGQNAVFPHAPFYVQRHEYAIAHLSTYSGTILEWFDFANARFELLDGETEVAPGVSVVTTPGHTGGHQSVRIETTDGPAIIIGDAAWTVEAYQRVETPIGTMDDMEGFRKSVRKLHGLKPTAVHFCHDVRSWRRGH